MFHSFREPNFFTLRVILSHIALIFTFSVDFVSHLATFSHMEGIFTIKGAQNVGLDN